MKQVYVNVTVRLIINADECVSDIAEVIQEIDYNFVSTTEFADVIDSEIRDYKVVGSE